MRMGEGLAALRGALWTEAKARKPAKCAFCGTLLEIGARVFRPLGNGSTTVPRYWRACPPCAYGIPAEEAAR